jgi:plastocyanin
VALCVLAAGCLLAGCSEPPTSSVGTGPLDVAPTVAVPTPSPRPALAAAQSGPSPAAGSPAPGPSDTITITDHGLMDAVGLADVEIEVSDFAFSPTTLVGTPGQHLRIAIENVSTSTHNFSLDAQGVRQDITPGGRATVTVDFPPSGSLQFYCTFHAAQGMRGQLQAGPPRP